MTKALIGCGLLCFLAACSDGKGSSNHSAYLDQDARDLAADGLSKRPSQEFLAARKDVEGSLPPAEKSYASHYNLAQSDGEKIAKDKALKKPRRSVAKGLKLEIDEVKEEDADTAGEALAETLAALREVDEDAESCADLDDEERILNCAVAWLLLEVQRSRKETADAGKPAPVKDAGGEADTGSDEPMDAGVDANSDGGKTDAGREAGADAARPDAAAPVEAGSLCSPTSSQLPSFIPSNLPADFEFASNTVVIKSANDFDTDSLAFYYKIPELMPKVVTLADGSEAAVIVVQRFELGVGQKFQVSGKRPLILVALEDIVIGGQITAIASTTNGYASGGAPGPTVPERKGFGLGGGIAGTLNKQAGGGGSFCGMGGRGNNTTGDSTDSVTYGTSELVPLVGGSSGGVAQTIGGLAGGAVQLVAGKTLTINESGIIDMTGSGGPTWAGGSSGGAVLLEAPKVVVAGTITANGGSGGSYNAGVRGTRTSNPAPGGLCGSDCADSYGGDGSAAEKINGMPAHLGIKTQYLNGGGGGAGRIRINTGCGAFMPGSNALITPSMTTVCATSGTLTLR